MKMHRRIAGRVGKAAATVLSPIICRAGGHRVLAAGEAYFAFLGGKGAGSGWDQRREVKLAASRVTRQDAVVFDVGANNGAWAAAFATAARSSELRFYLFECSPHVLPHLRQRLGSIPHPTVVEAAVSDHDGQIHFFVPSGGAGLGAGLASAHERRDVGVAQSLYDAISVPAITIDSFVKMHGIDRIDLLKMDIEGHELHALRGASQSLGRGVIRSLTFEFGSANINSRTFFRDYYDFLVMHRFELYRMAAGETLVPIKRYSEELKYFRGANNCLAIRE